MLDQLLTSLSQNILDENHATKQTSQDVEDVRQKLSDIKVEYYQSSLLCTALNELLLRHNTVSGTDALFDNDNNNNNNKDSIYEVVHHLLQSVDAHNCLHISTEQSKNISSEDENLFGLSHNDFIIPTPKKKVLHQSIQQILVPQMENYLKTLSLELYRFVNPTNEDSEGLALAKANKLPTYIDNETHKLNTAKASLQRETEAFEEKYDTCLNGISQLLDALENDYLCAERRTHPQTSKVNVDWLSAKCRYVLEKVRVMRQRVHLETYTNENTTALRHIHRALTKQIKETRKDIQKVKHSLAVYESIGDGFTKLLHEYTQLTGDVDLKKWALAELKSGKGGTPKKSCSLSMPS